MDVNGNMKQKIKKEVLKYGILLMLLTILSGTVCFAKGSKDTEKEVQTKTQEAAWTEEEDAARVNLFRVILYVVAAVAVILLIVIIVLAICMARSSSKEKDSIEKELKERQEEELKRILEQAGKI